MKTTNKRYVIFAIFTFLLLFESYAQTVNVSGTLQKWHRINVTLTLPGGNLTETGNTFRNSRMDIIFTRPNGSTIRVPGFFAADNNAANTNATSGNVFKGYLRPDATGTWSYRVLYYTGNNVATQAVNNLPSPVHDITGTIGNILNTNKTAPDLRAKGRLSYQTSGTNNSRRYLKFAETNEHFLKFGPDSPENFLDYNEFDFAGARDNCNLCVQHLYNPHSNDFNNGDPTWDGGKGTNIIGAINYLSEVGQVNSISMSLFGGDDKNVFPWTAVNSKFIYDVSKLEQWEIVMNHAEQKGLLLHFKLAEAENWSALNTQQINTYYREMVARFGHHLGVEWNISEEYGGNNLNGGSAANARPRIAFLTSIDPWNNHRVIHTRPEDSNKQRYDDFLGFQNPKTNLTGASMQNRKANNYVEVFNLTRDLIVQSRNNSTPWVVASDEQEFANNGVFTTNSETNSSVDPQGRKGVLWGNLMAGGAGVMWYGGSRGDFRTENFNRYVTLNAWGRHAITTFFKGQNIEFWKMDNNDNLVSGGGNRCLAEVGQSYVIYLPNGGSTNLNLNGQSGNFEVKWFNPRNGGAMQNSNVTSISGGGNRSIGNPPNATNSDWVALVTSTSGNPSGSTTVTLSPVNDAYLQGSTNFNNTIIRLENNNRTGYLMYDLSGINGTITAADLTFVVNSDAGSGNLNVNLGTSNNWTETTLSDANKPDAGVLLGSLNSTYAIGDSKTISLNASAISGNTISLILAPTGGNDFAIASKENSATEPQLTITYSSGNTNNVPVTGVSVSQSSLNLQVGQNSTLNATIAPNNATNQSINWSSSNNNIATVSNNGVVMAIAAGSATITATSVDGGFTAVSNITVNTPNTGGDCNDADYEESNGLVVIETENLNISGTEWQIKTEKAGFTGAGYIEWTGNDFFNGNLAGTAGVISTRIRINTPGVYKFDWRNSIARGTSTTDLNDSWLRFPDAADFYGEKPDGSRTYPRGETRGRTPFPAGQSGDGFFKMYVNNLNWSFQSTTGDNADGRPVFVEFATAGVYTMEIAARSEGHIIDRIVLSNGATNPLALTNTETPCTGSPTNPNALAIPGTIQVENFVAKNGQVQAENTPGTNGGQNLGFIQNNNYTEYDVNVATTGAYTLSAFVSSNGVGGTIVPSINGTNLNSLAVSVNNAWHNYSAVTSTINLTQGLQKLRFTYTGPNGFLFNVERVELSLNSNPPNNATSFVIEAEDFTSTDGTFNDASAGGPGLGVNVAGNIINFVNNGDWAEYSIDLSTAGTYDVEYLITTPSDGSQIQLLVDGTVASTTNVPNNGSWDSFTTLSSNDQVTLSAGPHTIRILASSNTTWQWNLDKITFTPAGSSKTVLNKTSELAIKVIPNPASEATTVSGLENNKSYSYGIFNINGALILKGVIDSKNSTINTSSLVSGMYFLNITSDSYRKLEKLIISE